MKKLLVVTFLFCAFFAFGQIKHYSFLQKVGNGKAEKVTVKRKIEYWKE